ncbi:MAG: aminotransferase class V-fold PLP-dependent enzyme [Burkholderiaceae bacterium]
MTQATSRPDSISLETLLAQGGGEISEPFREIVPPIHLSTTYERAPDGAYPGGAVYIRDHNPSLKAPEQLLAALEGGAEALLYSSGMGAAAAVFQALPAGARIVAPRIMYWGLRAWLIDHAQSRALTLEFFDFAGDGQADVCGTANLARLLSQPTDLLWLETPANPTWEVTDIEAAARLAHASGALVAVDSTVATPVLTRPIDLGADLVMHSATKYLNGHGDVLAGALVCARADPLWARIRAQRGQLGPIPGPFEAWLLLRGMRTLFPRVRLATQSAAAIAAHFDGHSKLVAVLYPGLASHPGHAIAARQMRDGFGGMLSIRVAGGAQRAREAAARMKLFKQATSLGSTESLVEHRASIEGPATACPDDLLRLSVGIESVQDLVADLERSLG